MGNDFELRKMIKNYADIHKRSSEAAITYTMMISMKICGGSQGHSLLNEERPKKATMP